MDDLDGWSVVLLSFVLFCRAVFRILLSQGIFFHNIGISLSYSNH